MVKDLLNYEFLKRSEESNTEIMNMSSRSLVMFLCVAVLISFAGTARETKASEELSRSINCNASYSGSKVPLSLGSVEEPSGLPRTTTIDGVHFEATAFSYGQIFAQIIDRIETPAEKTFVAAMMDFPATKSPSKLVLGIKGKVAMIECTASK